MYGYIYKTINLINNKIYIGQHKSSNFDMSYLGSGILIQKAIKLFGKENFKVILIEECNSKESLDEREVYYIDLFNSTDLNIGYNISNGGQKRFFTGMHHSEKSKELMSIKAKQRKHLGTTNGRIYINKNEVNKCIKLDILGDYLNDGWNIGKFIKNKKSSWNKGLTKYTDERVRKNSINRENMKKDNKSIGCFRLKGRDNSKFKLSKKHIDDLDINEVYNFWYENGKQKTKEKYKAYGNIYDYLCEKCNIVDTKEHDTYIRKKARNNYLKNK